ncbi:UNVERIFIED_CONTAM: hypothetical protein Scaly_2750400 [Sesamum calycinum]|uniref:Reverse transcriptase domain-containing protein n=1 Tax=Sesamum calycinum TaxID=2727403 RepID=A0AAW2J1V0_9LAMI
MSEVCGASADIHLAMNEFRDCILGTGLIHLPVQGELFSWHNCSEGDRSLWKRLDRLLVNDAWLRLWPNSHYQCLNARTSDHSPLVLRGDTDNHTVSMFRFDNYLTMSSEFIPLVQNVWRHRIEGTSMYAVTRKLRALKPVFRTLRKKKGDLSVNVKLAAEFLATVQQLLQIDRHNTLLLCLEKCCKLVFFKATKLEQRLLGGDRRREFIDLRYLRPWARHVLTQEESQALVQSVTREEIKDAFFDIAEDKAPGPDGYSSGFYKAAWPVIGEEMIKAILEFFTTGRLLKQVNTTILALIPKVRAPSTVSDFRPISCCNVLYKVITKIIVQRLRLVLDKLISPSQNAFVPGRSIGDNILLAQELFAGYNRQGLPMRCALKVDLRKAYDTVEWDFLSAVLQMFGFPGTFIGWVEECVTTPMFSVCINGNPHGFFKGSRGLRQGDPMSPFLFVLIMEVLQLMLLQLIDQNEGFSFHWRCKELGLFQLCFADDLLLFCKAMWLRFGYLDTGWRVRQTVRATCQSTKESAYSLPFSTGCPGTTTCSTTFPGGSPSPQGSSERWKKRCVPSCGKETQQWDIQRAWSVVCKPIEEGGQGIRDILALNKALMSRHLWNVIQNNQSSIWVKWIAHTRLRHKSPRLLDHTISERPWQDEHTGGSKTLRGTCGWIGVGLLSRIWNVLKFYVYRLFTMAATLFWRGGGFSTKAVYDIFRNHGPKVGWYSLLLGPCKIPRYSFVLWMAILDKLSTMDKPWLSHLGGVCVLCGREMETHEHLFFRCNYSRQCIRILKGTVRFTWPNRAWAVDIAWASKRWNGRHIVQAAYRALLAAIVYHIWQERNRRVFQQSMRPSSTIARIVVDEMRQKIISIDLPDSVSSRGLYRLWRIPWPVRGTA